VLADFRSDTLTRPTPAMRRAMAEAEVGDDVFGEDPTVNRLEARIAELLGKEAGLFVPSGTMANQIAFRVLTEPGDEIVMEADAHPFHYESGGAAVISGVTIRLLQGRRGVLDPASVASAIRPPNVHHAPARLVSVENTSNRGGGCVTPVGRCAAIAEIAHSSGIWAHLDGARLWNAHVASGASLAEFARPFDVVNVCFSKGLGAPVGSMWTGPRALAEKARRVRKMLGGGMRQVGILAAAADHAVTHHVERLAEDHGRALRLWEGLRAAGHAVEDAPETNILFCSVADAPSFVTRLAEAGVRAIPMTQTRVRFVTHLDIGDAQVVHAIEVVKRLAPGP
jgi:threonine aldolase